VRPSTSTSGVARRHLHCQSRPPSLSLHATARRAGPLLPASRRRLCRARCPVRLSRRSDVYCSHARCPGRLRARRCVRPQYPAPRSPAQPRRLRLAAAVPGPACRGWEGGCGPAATPGLRGPRGAAPIALGRAVPSPACRGREGRRAASAPRPATPPHCGTLQCRTPLRPAALARYRISRGRRMRPPPERRVGRG